MYSLIMKPVGEVCNVDCTYCYFKSHTREGERPKTMSPEILELALSEYARANRHFGSITWHGGEPLLAGFDFFKQAVEIEKKTGGRFKNSLQTNGTLLNESLVRLLYENNFLIGLSIDGPREIHNRRRPFSGNVAGSFDRAMEGLRLLQKNHADYNMLSVIGQHNVSKAAELYAFYEENSIEWVQFIPQMAFTSFETVTPTAFDLTPEQYFGFLSDFFNIWYRQGIGSMSVRYFDNVLQTYMNETPDICTMQGTCPDTVVIDLEGNMFPCDFYHGNYWKLGNIEDMEISEALKSDKFLEFKNMKPSLPDTCVKCKWLKKCHGGCPRNRISGGTINGPDYFCDTFKSFYETFDSKFSAIAKLQDYIRNS